MANSLRYNKGTVGAINDLLEDVDVALRSRTDRRHQPCLRPWVMLFQVCLYVFFKGRGRHCPWGTVGVANRDRHAHATDMTNGRLVDAMKGPMHAPQQHALDSQVHLTKPS